MLRSESNHLTYVLYSMQFRLAQSSQVSTVLQRLVTLAAGFVMEEWGARWVDWLPIGTTVHCPGFFA